MVKIKKIKELKTVMESPLEFIEDKDPKLNDASLGALFFEIAKYLIQNVVITIGRDTYYSFAEVEFYYYKENSVLKDDPLYYCTYPREKDAMEFFFHNSGVDICFKSSIDKGKMEFGGVLIRTLKKNNKEIIAGPMRCAIEIMNSSFAKGVLPVLDESRGDNYCGVKTTDIKSTIRYGIENVLRDKYDDIKKKFDENKLPLFCYYVPQTTWTRTYKKRIIKDSKNGGYKSSLKDYYGANPEKR